MEEGDLTGESDVEDLHSEDDESDEGELTTAVIPDGTLLAGRYRVVELLGEGAMGAVYRAEHVHMRKPFAVKVLHRELTTIPEVVKRFEREAIAAGRIDHPHVARAHDFGVLEGDAAAHGGFYLVLEFVEGRRLSDALAEGAFDLGRALVVTRQIAEALLAAHTAGIVHRDLKPDNVMLVERLGELDYVKVLDFGIAKMETGESGPALTRLGTVFGTPSYMAPEQAAGQSVDSRVDLYTLGLMLHEMLTGKACFEGDEPGQVIMRQITEAPPELPPHIDPDVARLTMALLEKQPDGRLQTAAQLLQILDEIMGRLALFAPGSVRVSGPPPGLINAPMPPAPPLPADVAAAETEPEEPKPGLNLSWGAAVGAGAGLLVVGALMGGVVGASFGGDSSQGKTARAANTADDGPPAATAGKPSAELEALLAKAAAADLDAIKKLEQRPPEQRTAPEWLALARGRIELERYPSALDAYEKALFNDPKLGKDRTLLRHIRQAAGRKDTGLRALGIAEQQLGPEGADILYDVWVATRAKTEATSVARALVYGDEVRKKATPALNVVLDLREAQNCEDYKKLLPRVALKGDTRTLRVLQKLKQTHGCGTMAREDCWGCLRKSDELDKTIALVQKRPQPRF